MKPLKRSLCRAYSASFSASGLAVPMLTVKRRSHRDILLRWLFRKANLSRFIRMLTTPKMPDSMHNRSTLYSITLPRNHPEARYWSYLRGASLRGKWVWTSTALQDSSAKARTDAAHKTVAHKYRDIQRTSAAFAGPKGG